MEDFKGLSRDTVRAKTPPMQWEFARNILLSKGFLSVTNEDGFDYKHNIPGIFIGKIETNEEIIYFSVDGLFSCIGIYRTNEDPATYIPVIRSQYLGFKINRPIEGVFFYNYKKELIISFCDGVFLDSNTPKLINLTDIGVSLNGSYEFINPTDVEKLELYPYIREGEFEINYLDNSFIDIEVAYITYAYVLDDSKSLSAYFPTHTIAYPLIGFKKEVNRIIQIIINGLDPRYKSIKLGIIVVKEGGLFAYESNEIPYGNFNNISYTLSSLNNFNESTPDKIIIPTSTYNRIRTMTVNNNELVIGNLASDSEISFQKYANLLKLQLEFDLKPRQNKADPTLCPDEVYSFTISLQKLDGNYTEEFHIPGEPSSYFASTNDLELLTTSDINALGLSITNLPTNLRRFHLINTGGWINTTFERPVLNFPSSQLRWGCWRNEETYPINDNYNSLIDYEGNPFVGGEDLRGTPVRYHRIPGLDNLVEKFPSILGYTNENQYADDNSAWVVGQFRGAIPNFAVSVSNYQDVVPLNMRKQFQGYRISIVRRRSDSNLVEDITFADTAASGSINPQPIQFGTSFYSPNTVFYPREVGVDPVSITAFNNYKDVHFGYSSLKSNNLFINKNKIGATIVKANYAFINNNYSTFSSPNTISDLKDQTDNEEFNGKIGSLGSSNVRLLSSASAVSVPSYYKIALDQKYANIISITYAKENISSLFTFGLEESIFLNASNGKQILINGGKDIGWNPLLAPLYPPVNANVAMTINDSKVTLDAFVTGNYIPTETYYPAIGICITLLKVVKNLYLGLTPTEFITIGRVTTAESGGTPQTRLRFGGDVFTNNAFSIYHTKIYPRQGTDTNYDFAPYQYLIKGNFSIYNNSQIYNKEEYSQGDTTGTILISFLQNSTSNPSASEDNISNFNKINGFDLSTIIYNKLYLASLNNLITGIAFNINNVFINYFPYRVHKSLSIQSENLTTDNIRNFPVNSYKDMLNDRGEIVALRGSNKILYIQQKYSLFLATIKDTLVTQDATAYLGVGDIFDRVPEEIMDASNKGFLGSTSQYACILYRDGYITIDQVKGKMYIVNGTQSIEISKEDMVNWFENNANTDSKFFTLDRFNNKQVVDNPYTQVGHLIGFDLKYNRLLWTKKDFRFKTESLEEGDTFEFDGEFYYVNDIKKDYSDIFWFEELSRTFSFSLDGRKWVCEHDYFPNAYFYTNRGLYSNHTIMTNSLIYKHNSKLNKGNFYGITYDSYIDPVFNSRLDLSKLYQNITWNTVVYDPNEQAQYFKTIDAIMLYNDVQCTGVIDLNPNTISLERNIEGNWNFNDFRDLVINKNLPVIDSRGRLVTSNINNNGSWFEKSNFINTFIVVRMIMKNQTNDAVYINIVNVKSRISDRT